MRVRTRFAPSPTGFMHIGNLRTALYAYLFAKGAGGDFILRIEDTDQARYVEGAVDFIKRTLKAAKIEPDEGPDIGGDFGPYVQSERMAIYKKYAEELVAKGAAYRCFCEPHERASESVKTSGEFAGYDRRCRDIPTEEADRRAAAGEPYVIRQKMPLAGETTFFDVVHGNITIANDTLEDQVLLKRDGMPTYNFANVIDDHLMQVSHIIRGVEFITSTPKHVLLYDAFGWTAPAFCHLPPVMGKAEDGTVSKLSKRHGATSFEDLVAMGYLPEAITNYVALLGWSPKSTQEIFTLEELIAAFSLEGLSKAPAVFDYNKLAWLNGEYFKAMAPEKFAAAARSFAGDLPQGLAAKWPYLAALLQPRLSRFDEIPGQIAFLMTPAPFDLGNYTNKRNKVTPEKAAEIIPAARARLAAIAPDDWQPERLNACLDEYGTASGYKKGLVMWPLRVALSGQKVTPGGVTEILYLLGKEESLRRFDDSLGKLQAAI